MSSIFKPSNLTIKYSAPATHCRPLDGRKYTLTHCDKTDQLFLTIGREYDFGATNINQHVEVLAEWIPRMGEFILWGRVYISGGEYEENYAKVRYLIFQKELRSELAAIVYGDKTFFDHFPWLLDAPIYIQFESDFPQYNQIGYYGTPRNYMLATNKETVS